MYRLFYSYDLATSYVLAPRCRVQKIFKEQGTNNGLLVICTQNLFEVVEYHHGEEKLFLSCIASKDGCRVDKTCTVNEDAQHVLQVLESLIRKEIYHD